MITSNASVHEVLSRQSIREVPVERSDGETAELLSVLRHGRPNLLIIGSAIQNERAFDRIREMLRAPVAWWSPLERPEIPESVFRTLIVRHVECLTASQQVGFAAWLRRSPETQIVSLARMPVFPLVNEGTFLSELYYHLNVFCWNSDATLVARLASREGHSLT